MSFTLIKRDHCFYGLNEFFRGDGRLLGVDQPVGHGHISLQRNRNKIGVDILVDGLCDQDAGVHLTQRKGINPVIKEA